MDPDTGVLETAKELDRETLAPSGLLILPVAVSLFSPFIYSLNRIRYNR